MWVALKSVVFALTITRITKGMLTWNYGKFYIGKTGRILKLQYKNYNFINKKFFPEI